MAMAMAMAAASLPCPSSPFKVLKSIKTLLSWYKKPRYFSFFFFILMTGKLDEIEAKGMQLHLSYTPF
jgi:hypothetical protein